MFEDVLLLLNIFMIIHIYIKLALTRRLTAHDCGGLWAGAHFLYEFLVYGTFEFGPYT